MKRKPAQPDRSTALHSQANKRIRLAVIAIMPLLPWATGCHTGPFELVSKECDVAITMPGSPSYEPRTFVVDGEMHTNYQSRVARDGITFGFICTPAPGLMKGDNQREVLASAKQGWLLSRDKRLITERDVMLRGRLGLELVMAMTATGETLRNRTFVFPDATVNISVIGSAADVALPVADRFLDSLRLTSS
jgi:hypothetical protein